MSKLVTGDGRTHIASPLMRESLVDRRVIAKTQSDREFEIMPDVALVGIGGQSIFDRGKEALLPLVAELGALRSKHKIVVGVGGGTRVRHTVSVAIDLGIPTGGIAQLVGDGQDGVLAAIEDRLPADADQHDVGEHLELALRVRARDDLAIDERLAHQRRLDVRAPIALQ